MRVGCHGKTFSYILAKILILIIENVQEHCSKSNLPLYILYILRQSLRQSIIQLFLGMMLLSNGLFSDIFTEFTMGKLQQFNLEQCSCTFSIINIAILAGIYKNVSLQQPILISNYESFYQFIIRYNTFGSTKTPKANITTTQFNTVLIQILPYSYSMGQNIKQYFNRPGKEIKNTPGLYFKYQSF